MSAPRTPPGLRASGGRLWRETTRALELDEHERLLLLEACRTADTLDALADVISREGAMRGGEPHPALIESRQQRLALARLIASLRLPDDMTAPAGRPQRRGAARGSYRRSEGT